MRRMTIGLVAALASIYATASVAGDLRSIKMVIERQVAGLRSDDPQLLADTISAQIRSMFTDEQAALDAFKRYFPGASDVRISGFGMARQTELGFVQPTRISDRTGRLWEALYAVKRDETGRWLVYDVAVVEIPTVSA
jgi:Domain of unknown function (DUF4864)